MNKRAPITITLTRPLPPTVKAALDSLRETFPDALTQPPRPLAEDILSVAQETLAEQHSKKSIRRALAAWCNQIDYLRTVTAPEAHCIHLDGSDAGPVPPEQLESARKRLAIKEAAATPPPEPTKRPRPKREPSAPQAAPSDPTSEEGPRISIRQRPKLDKNLVLADAVPRQQAQRPKLSLKKPSKTSS